MDAAELKDRKSVTSRLSGGVAITRRFSAKTRRLFGSAIFSKGSLIGASEQVARGTLADLSRNIGEPPKFR